MKIEDFLSQLKGVTSVGDGAWVACCPAHGDEHPSMSVTSKDGKILVHCHTGCTASDIVGAMGLQLKDLFEDSKESRSDSSSPAPSDHGAGERAALLPNAKKSGSHGKWVCDYVYHDAEGNILYKASRFVLPSGRKSFQIKHRDGSAPGGWAYGLKDAGIPRVVYHLPEVVRAAKAGHMLVIAEGEKDVDNIRNIGFAATCNVGGAGKWGYGFPDDWAGWFKGLKGILIIADNDPATKAKRTKVRGKDEYTETQEPFLVGQKHALDVASQLRRAGVDCTIKIMTMPEGKDFTDWQDEVKKQGRFADAAAFKAIVKSGAETVEAFAARFGLTVDDAHGEPVAPAEKGGRDALSADQAKPSAGGKAGRFGRPAPRAPGKDVDEYEVSFDVGSGVVVKLKFNYGATVKAMTCYAIATVSGAFPNREMPKGVLPRIKSWTAAIWLIMRGKFFWDLDNRVFSRCMYLDCNADSCRLMMIESDEFYAFVSKAAELDDVDPKKGDLGKIMGVVKQVAISDDYSTGVNPSNMWDRRGDAVYISSGDTQMYRLKGGAVKMVQNGTDGVVFLRGKTLAPWKLLDGDGVDPFANALIFKGASWADAKNGPVVVRSWVLNLFACHASKPPLLITGVAGSGKTRMAKAVKEILGVRTDGQLDMSVQQMEDGDKGLDAFWATVNDGRLEVFDNLDTKIKWASDTLQIAATDGQTKRRTLYTTYGVSILKAKAFLIFTSNNPIVSTEGNGGMADRLIALRLLRNRVKSMDKELSMDIAENRDAYMTWMARTVAKALVDDKPVENTVNERHPDFGDFAIRCGRACGMEDDFVSALCTVEVDKLLLPIQNDTIGREILGVLIEKDFNFKFTASEMSTAIINRMADEKDEKTPSYYSSRKIGKAISRYSRQLRALFKFEGPRTIAGYPVYEVHGTRVDVSGLVSLVSLNGDFAKSVGGADAHGFTGNGVLNSPNSPGTPYARAQNNTPLHGEEGEEGSNGEGVSDGKSAVAGMEDYDELEF